MTVYRHRRGTTTQWATPTQGVLKAGEIGENTTTGEVKIGDGATAFAALPGFNEDANQALITEYAAPVNGRSNSVVWLGDSITADGNFPRTDNVVQPGISLGGFTAMIMTRCPSLRYRYNAGVGGDRTTMMMDRWESDVVAKNPKVLHILAGVNDTGNRVPIATTYDNLRFFITEGKKLGATVFIGTIPPRNDQPTWLPDIDKINVAIKSMADELGAHVIDYHKVLVDPSNGNYKAGLNADTVHPNLAGKKVMAQEAWAVFTRVLGEGSLPVSMSQYAASPNLVTNSCFLTDTNTDGVPDGWDTTTGTTSSETYSLISDDTDFLGNAWQFEFTGASNRSRYYTVAGSWSVGDTVVLTGKYKAAVEAGSGIFQFRLLFTGSSQVGYTMLAPLGVNANFDTDRVGQFYAEGVIPPGTTSLVLQLNAFSGAGMIRLGQVALWKLDTDGYVV